MNRSYLEIWKDVVLNVKFMLLRFLVRRKCRKEENSNRILLIRDDHLGDFMVSLPLFQQIHTIAKSEGWSVAVAVNENIADFARKCPFIDEVIPISRKKLARSYFLRLKTYRWFSQYSARKVINCLIGCSGIEDYLVYFTSAKEKYLSNRTDSWMRNPTLDRYRKLMNPYYTHVFSYDASVTILHNEARLYSEALGRSISPVLGNLDFLKPFPKPQISGKYYIVVPGSMSPPSRWNPEKFAAVIDVLSTVYPELTPVISGIAPERNIIDNVLKCCKHSEKVITLCGNSNIMELIGNIAGASLVLTNCTGPLHVAAKLKIPTFCVVGEGHWGVFSPNPLYETVTYLHANCEFIRCGWKCRKAIKPNRYPCVEQVSAEQVIDAIHSYMKNCVL